MKILRVPPTRQHELEHTDHTLSGLLYYIKIDFLFEVREVQRCTRYHTDSHAIFRVAASWLTRSRRPVIISWLKVLTLVASYDYIVCTEFCVFASDWTRLFVARIVSLLLRNTKISQLVESTSPHN